MGDSCSEERKFKRSYDSLHKIFEFINEFFVTAKIDRSHVDVVSLAVEELFTNMVKYNRGGAHDILIGFERIDDHLAVSLTDFDVDRFDPTQTRAVRVDKPIEERNPGGLGIHLVKQMVDRIDYTYVDRKSTTTFLKTLG